MSSNKKIDKEVYYNKKDTIGQYLSTQRNKEVLKKIKGKLMDLGCGDGTLINAYKGESIGVDIKDYGSANIVVKNFNNIPVEDAFVDTLTIVASLNYFEDPDKVLTECHRMLRQNGQLLITMPNEKIMKTWHLFRESWAHKSGYSRKELYDLLHQNGFKLSEKSKFLFGLNNLYVFKKK